MTANLVNLLCTKLAYVELLKQPQLLHDSDCHQRNILSQSALIVGYYARLSNIPADSHSKFATDGLFIQGSADSVCCP